MRAARSRSTAWSATAIRCPACRPPSTTCCPGAAARPSWRSHERTAPVPHPGAVGSGDRPARPALRHGQECGAAPARGRDAVAAARCRPALRPSGRDPPARRLRLALGLGAQWRCAWHRGPADRGGRDPADGPADAIGRLVGRWIRIRAASRPGFRGLDRGGIAGAGRRGRARLQRGLAAAARRPEHGRLRRAAPGRQASRPLPRGGRALGHDRTGAVRRAAGRIARGLAPGCARCQRPGGARIGNPPAAAALRLRPRRCLHRGEPRPARGAGCAPHRPPVRRARGRPRLELLVAPPRGHAALLRRRAGPHATNTGGRMNTTTRAALLALAIGLSGCGADAPEQVTAAAPQPQAEEAARAPAGEEVFYHLFQRSFRDGNGDRIGDLAGLTQKLDYLKDLGVTSLLLTPLQPSPFYHNYFPTDFEAIDPAYGTREDYIAFVRAAHARGLKVYLDQEIQYVGEGHPWWTRALADPQAPEA